MKNIEEIISELKSWTDFDPYEHPINKILKDIPEQKYLYKNNLPQYLKSSLNEKDGKRLENILSIVFYDGIDPSYAPLLNSLIKEDWHYSHEDIAMILEEIKDPASVDALYETALNIPDFDDGRALARKCIWALGAINTPAAREKLTLLANMEDPIISEVATMELS